MSANVFSHSIQHSTICHNGHTVPSGGFPLTPGHHLLCELQSHPSVATSVPSSSAQFMCGLLSSNSVKLMIIFGDHLPLIQLLLSLSVLASLSPSVYMRAQQQLYSCCSSDIVLLKVPRQYTVHSLSPCRYRPSVPVAHVAHTLAFSLDECSEWLTELGLPVSTGPSPIALDCKMCLPIVQAAS